MQDRVILGIESSCDDTAAALIRARPGQPVGTVLASEVIGQDALHAAFGGVVPEIAARAHAERLDLVTAAALTAPASPSRDLDAVAVTAGPGLIGGVLAGVMFAKGLAAARGLPLWGVNHLAGHALTPRLTDDVAFPYLMLLVSGGHCQFLAVLGPERFRRLGGTIDDAPGEAFDKVAKLLGLGQPGGPAIEAEARDRRPPRLRPPPPAPRPPRLRPLLLRPEDRGPPRPRPPGRNPGRPHPPRPRRPRAPASRPPSPRSSPKRPAAPSSASATSTPTRARPRRRRRRRRQRQRSAPPSPPSPRPRAPAFLAPPLALCTDNGAIIAWAAAERMATGAAPDGLTLSARPRWPLDAAAAPMLGAGRKGAKA